MIIVLTIRGITTIAINGIAKSMIEAFVMNGQRRRWSMTREEARREMFFAKREVMADSYIDKAYDMAIKALEEPERTWIPCSERLPEEGQEILATTTDNAWGDVVIIRTFYKEMHKSIIAWMPLPEPYREGEG